MKRSILLYVVIMVTLVACSPANMTDDPERTEVLQKENSDKGTTSEGVTTSGPFAELEERIEENYPNLFSCIVVHKDEILFEKYYQGMTAEDANPVYSITKSVTSALVGIAVEQRLIGSIDDKLSEYLPEYFEDLDDPDKGDITVYHALTMSAGLAPIDVNYSAYFSSEDWLKYTLDQKLYVEPGKAFQYNTGLTNFLSAVITETSGMSTYEYAQANLFEPIEMEVGIWDQDPQRYYTGGAGIAMTPRNLVKFGLLYLHNGKYEGKQVVPESWVEASVKEQIPTDQSNGYGYLFWSYPEKVDMGDHKADAFAAVGAGGQYVVVVPELDLVVVITASLMGRTLDGQDNSQLVWNYVVPVIRESGE